MAEVTYSSNGKANLATVLGAVGTGLGLLNSSGAGTGLNILGGGNSNYATKTDLENAIALAQKDNEITLLKSESNTESKMVDVYERVMTRVNADKAEQAAVNAQQGIYNSTMNAAVQVLQGQTSQLLGLTKLVVPNTSCCPGWGNVTIYPTGTGGTTTT